MSDYLKKVHKHPEDFTVQSPCRTTATCRCLLTRQTYPPASLRGSVQRAQEGRLIRRLGRGAERRGAAGELFVSPFETGGEVKEG